MAWSYKKLWIMLIEHDMKKTELMRAAGITSNILSHLSKNESVPLDSLGKICKLFHCELGDIVEYIED